MPRRELMMRGDPLSSLGGWALAEAGGRGASVEGASQLQPLMD